MKRKLAARLSNVRHWFNFLRKFPSELKKASIYAQLLKTILKYETDKTLTLGLLKKSIYYIPRFTLENACVLDWQNSSIYTDIEKILFFNVWASLVRSCNSYCYGPSGTSEDALWADTYVSIEYEGNL